MSNKTMMTNDYQFADEAMGLNFALFANHDALLNFRKGTDKTIIPNPAAIEIYGFNHFYVDPELHIGNTGF